jgi:hypothetical protein
MQVPHRPGIVRAAGLRARADDLTWHADRLLRIAEVSYGLRDADGDRLCAQSLQ